MTTTLEQANEALRSAVKDRLDNTPKDDPKMVGYASEERTKEQWDSLVTRFVNDQFAKKPASPAFLKLLDDIRAMHISKSADYGSENDPLANIRSGADFVNIEPWKAAFVRIADKVQRLRTYCRTGRLVHEGVRDTLLDLASYSLLAIQLFDEDSGA